MVRPIRSARGLAVIALGLAGCAAVLGLPSGDPALDEGDSSVDSTAPPSDTGADQRQVEDGGEGGLSQDAEPFDANIDCGLGEFPDLGGGPRCPTGPACVKDQICCTPKDAQAQQCISTGDATPNTYCKPTLPRLDCESRGHCKGGEVCCLIEVTAPEQCSMAAVKTACKPDKCAAGEYQVCNLNGSKPCIDNGPCIPTTITFQTFGTLIEGICR